MTRPTADSVEPDRQPVLVIRQVVQALNALDRETADHLHALALILTRVARADGRVCRRERLRMEEILVEHAHIPAEHAALVTEIACHRAELADCGRAYSSSRAMRARLGSDQRRSVVGLLAAVADADGQLRVVEEREICQIARELGVDPSEVVRARL